MGALTFSHIGITVPDLEKAVEFYSKAFGLYVLMEPTEILHDDSAIGEMCDDVFGEGWGKFRIAHLSMGDGIGIELFEFPKTVDEERPFEYWRRGLFHFCVQDPNIEDLVDKIVAHGGKQRMPIREYYPNEKPYKMVYVEDPFGLVFEIYTHSYELTYSQGAY